MVRKAVVIINTYAPNDRIIASLSFIFILSLTFGYFIEIGFALKPFMVIAFLVLLIYNIRLEIPKLHNFEVAYLLFLLYFSLTGAFAKYPEYSLRLILGIILSLICYFVLRFLFSKLSIKTIESYISRVGIIFNLISLILYLVGFYLLDFRTTGNGIDLLGINIDRDMPRMIGTFSDPNFYTVANFIFFFYYLTNLDKKRSKLGLTLTSLTILLTLSRGGFLAVALCLFLLFMKSSLKQKIKAIIFIPLGFMVLNYILRTTIYIDLYGLIINRFSNASGDGGSGRSVLWENGLSLFYDNPIFGVGLYNWRPYNMQLFGNANYMHNTFLEILVESGVIGILLFSFVFILLIIEYVSKMKVLRGEGAYVLLTLFSLMISMFSLSMIINEFLFLTFALLGRYFSEVNRKAKADRNFETVKRKAVV